MGGPEQETQDVQKERGKQSWAVVALILLVLLVLLLLWRYCTPSTGEVAKSEPPVATAIVPDVVGLGEAEAASVVRGAGFVADTTSVFDASVDPGVVVDQSPDAGLEAETGSVVSIKVATDFGIGVAPADGSEESPLVPDVIGESQDDAVHALETAGFVVSERRAHFEPYQRDTVYDQAPDGGTHAPYGSTVVIYVSNGPQASSDVTVPDTMGMTESQAVAAIRAAGLSPQVIKRPSQDSVGRVYDQFPYGGSVVPADSEVQVTVGASY